MSEVLVLGISRVALLSLTHRDVLWHGFLPRRKLNLLDVLTASEFRPRVEAEGDPEFKQLIPYVLLLRGRYGIDECDLYGYERGSGGGEARLYNRFSIGFGGHIEDTDFDVSPLDHLAHDIWNHPLRLYTLYLNAIARELTEEVSLSFDARSPVLESWGWINDDGDPAGRVHLGVLHTLYVDDAQSREPESIVDFRPYKSDQLAHRRDEMETWSRIVFDARVSTWLI